MLNYQRVQDRKILRPLPGAAHFGTSKGNTLLLAPEKNDGLQWPIKDGSRSMGWNLISEPNNGCIFERTWSVVTLEHHVFSLKFWFFCCTWFSGPTMQNKSERIRVCPQLRILPAQSCHESGKTVRGQPNLKLTGRFVAILRYIKMKHVYIDHQHYATHNGIKYTQIKYTEHSNKNFIATRESWYQNISIPKHEAFCDAHNTQNWAQPTPRPEYRCSWWFWHREQNSFLLGASSKLLRGWVWLESFSILQIGDGWQGVLLKLTKTWVCWSIMGILKLTKTLVCVSHVYGNGSRIREPVTKWAAFIPGAFDDPGFINPWDVFLGLRSSSTNS